jgi:hypothetical protein
MTVAFGSTPDAGQMVERRDLAGHQSGSNESRPMRYKIAELFCVRGRVKRDEEPFRRRRGVSNKRQVKTGIVVCACNLHQITRGQAAFNDMQGGLGIRRSHADHSNDSDRHDQSLQLLDAKYARLEKKRSSDRPFWRRHK